MVIRWRAAWRILGMMAGLGVSPVSAEIVDTAMAGGGLLETSNRDGGKRSAKRECVILLHGLARTSKSMETLAKVLEDSGYAVRNVDYPSRKFPIDSLSEIAIGRTLADSWVTEYDKIHFVTHSLGGILVRNYLAAHHVPQLGRVVMLGPPNHGSEVVDHLKDWWVFGKVNGPAGGELGTDSSAKPRTIQDQPFELGIVAGDRSINWINSLMIASPDDGKVSVERTKLPWMTDHVVVHTTHPMMMKNAEVMAQVVAFLKEGRFAR